MYYHNPYYPYQYSRQQEGYICIPEDQYDFEGGMEGTITTSDDEEVAVVCFPIPQGAAQPGAPQEEEDGNGGNGNGANGGNGNGNGNGQNGQGGMPDLPFPGQGNGNGNGGGMLPGFPGQGNGNGQGGLPGFPGQGNGQGGMPGFPGFGGGQGQGRAFGNQPYAGPPYHFHPLYRYYW
ncbi:hypothetical protein [Halobacillus sp. B23F22_1]|uniref:hypothetical protein n=1 Tax=Halobacillus sp. B23F22_1 TaxID=3459514 RepID=UPI00373E5BC4